MKQDVAVEVEHLDGTGVFDYAPSVLGRSDITITRGRQNESGQPAPARARWSFAGHRFNPENPASDLFGKIGRNTPVRITLNGDDDRFTGDIISWTPWQSLGGPNVPPDEWVEVEAAGITHRLSQGQDPLQSTLRRVIPGSSNVVAYWPLDAGKLSTVGLPEVGTTQFGPLLGTTRFGAGDLVPWLEPGIAFEENCTMRGDVRMGTAPPIVTVRVVLRRDGTGGPTVLHTVGNTDDGGNDLILTFTPPDTVELQLNHDGSFVDLASVTNAVLFDGKVHHVQLGAGPSDPSAAVLIDGVFVVSVDGSGSPLTGISQVRLSYNPGTGGHPMAAGHLAVWGDDSLTAAQLVAYRGYGGEHAGDRIERLCDEESVPLGSIGDREDTVPMGPQYPDGLLALLRECADTDHGWLLDRKDNPGVLLRTHRSAYNVDPTLTLDYDDGEVAPPLVPVIDDHAVRNDITASNRDGDTANAVDTSGPLGVTAIGRYRDQPRGLSPLGQGGAAAVAGWRLHLGTHGGTRFPRVTVDLDANPDLAATVRLVEVGSRLDLEHLPATLTPDLARLLVQGWSERIGTHRRLITFNCTPYAVLDIAEVEHETLQFVGSASATLNLDRTDTVTTMQIIANGYPWIYEADFDILVGGERMTVTAVAAGTGTFPNRVQNLTVTRSVNGIVKSHLAGTPVGFFHRAYIGL